MATDRDGPIELNRFQMAVPDEGYCWVEDITPAGPHSYRGPAPYMVVKSALARPSSGYKARSYFPLVEEPLLFRKFKNLELTKDSILAFANRYGWIGDACRVQRQPRQPLIGAVGLDAWQHEIQSMILANHLLECIESDDRSVLRQYFRWHPKAFAVNMAIEMRELKVRPADLTNPGLTAPSWFFQLISVEDAEQIHAIGVNHGDVLGPARLALLKLVNPRLREHCHPHLMIRAHGEFVGHLTPDNLLGCMWLQFYAMLTGQLKLRICTVCKLEMDVTGCRKTRKMHERCAANSRQQRWRAGVQQRVRQDRS